MDKIWLFKETDSWTAVNIYLQGLYNYYLRQDC